MGYKHFTHETRESIERFLGMGFSLRKIAMLIGRSAAAISKEIKRNSLVGKHGEPVYNAVSAHRKAVRRKKQASKRKNNHSPAIIEFIKCGLKEDWAPEQIVGRWKYMYPKAQTICFKTIYRWLKEGSYAPQGTEWTGYAKHLRIKRPGKNCTRKHMMRQSLSNLPSIDSRPASIDKNIFYGNWECDLIWGHNRTGYILTAVEKKTGFLVAHFCKNKRGDTVNNALYALFNGVPKNRIRTLTYDRGKEFFCYSDVERKLGVKVYFCHPQCPTERALNENTNGLLRQYFPKGYSFTNVTQEDVKKAVIKINNRPRKKYGYKSIAETVRGKGFDALLTFV